MPPTATVSVDVRSESCQLLPFTGVTPTPVPNVIVDVRPPSTNVLDLLELNWRWFLHAVPHAVPGISSVWLPVSNTVELVSETTGHDGSELADAKGLRWRADWGRESVNSNQSSITGNLAPVMLPYHL